MLCFGLWRDRSKGRPRCPKCWYDMRGTLPRLECPECGNDAGEEQHLYADRIRRWPLALGCALLVLSWLGAFLALRTFPIVWWLG